jgi:hypothetical protein
MIEKIEIKRIRSTYSVLNEKESGCTSNEMMKVLVRSLESAAHAA